MDRIRVASGIAMPFFPMCPAQGRSLKSPVYRRRLWEDMLSDPSEIRTIVQPNLNGDRACLLVKDDKVLIQNRHGGWYRKNVSNKHDFLHRQMPDVTLFDGEVVDGVFHPAEVLVLSGKSLLNTTTSERVVLAFQLTRLIGQTWKFARPSKDWILAGPKNMPEADGVVLKQATGQYVLAGSADQSNLMWIKRCWS
jgi:hypothetical protein